MEENLNSVDWYYFLYVTLWIVGSVFVGIAVGYTLRGAGAPKVEPPHEQTARERATTVKTLVEILSSVEQLSSDVGLHNTELREVGRSLSEMAVTGDMKLVQQTFLHHIGTVLKSNQRMADDLVVAHYKIEMQAQELDRSRVEARTDTLSGMGNRKAFDETIQWLMSAWNRDREPFVLILADVDRFKWVNDTHGHQVGDAVLTQMSGLLKLCCRTDDVVTRYGGDEFAILLPRTELAAGNQVASRLRTQVWRSSFHMGKEGVQGVVSLSVGVAQVGEGDTIEMLLDRADKALYKSKEMGRNRVYCLGGGDREPQLVESASGPA